MSFWRRPEVLVLLALVGVGLLWVAWNEGASSWFAKKRDPADRPITLTITGAHAQPEGDHRRVRVEFTATHHEPAPLSARPPHVRLLGATGDELPAFFVPGEFPPDLPPGAPAASWFEGWLTPAQAAAPLTLEVAGQKADVVINGR